MDRRGATVWVIDDSAGATDIGASCAPRAPGASREACWFPPLFSAAARGALVLVKKSGSGVGAVFAAWVFVIMPPEETSPRPQLDSGQIDLIAMDRDARAAMAKMEEEARAKKAPPSPTSTAPWAVESSLDDGDDVDVFAQSLSSPWKRIPRVKLIAGGAGAFVLLLVIAIFASGGSNDDAKKLAAAVPTPSATDTAAALPPGIPPPPAATTPAPTPAPTTATTDAKPPTTTVADAKPSHGAKGHKPSRRVKPSGPKLMKVQSSGVAP